MTHSRIAISTDQPDQTIADLYRCWENGMVPCPLSSRLPRDKQNELAASVGACNQGISTFEVKTKSNIEDYPPDAISSILFTSGSTGTPKAVVHTFNNHIASAKRSNSTIPLGSGDKWLLSLPLYHVSGLSLLFRTSLAGASLINSSDKIATSIINNNITHISLVPTQLEQLLQTGDTYPTLKHILLGGAPIPETLIKRALDKLSCTIHTGYGLTETASHIYTESHHKDSPQPTIHHNPETLCIIKGEICVKGPSLCLGYSDSKNITQTQLNLDSDGWFHTGDLGQIDSNGRLSITGRKDTMFISGGENIHPEEIEKHLLTISSIEAAIVIPVMDETFGHRPIAYIKTNGNLDSEAIKETLRQTLPNFKVPDNLYNWPNSMPNETKLSRKRLISHHQLYSIQA
ncbi:AMP-binding protein [bacterium]|jgi:o-succinylbenzoate---CoA ligase|nr:AMP-binding protein [bacterium]